jgi:hypothetical protein
MSEDPDRVQIEMTPQQRVFLVKTLECVQSKARVGNPNRSDRIAIFGDGLIACVGRFTLRFHSGFADQSHAAVGKNRRGHAVGRVHDRNDVTVAGQIFDAGRVFHGRLSNPWEEKDNRERPLCNWDIGKGVRVDQSRSRRWQMKHSGEDSRHLTVDVGSGARAGWGHGGIEQCDDNFAV